MDKLHQLCMNDGGGGDVNNGDVNNGDVGQWWGLQQS
jgi:hypothetical protein